MTAPQSIWQGSFKLYGIDVRCHVLSDGRRIIEAESMAALLEAMASPLQQPLEEAGDIAAFARWQRGA